jgi:hypothetical protein
MIDHWGWKEATDGGGTRRSSADGEVKLVSSGENPLGPGDCSSLAAKSKLCENCGDRERLNG